MAMSRSRSISQEIPQAGGSDADGKASGSNQQTLEMSNNKTDKNDGPLTKSLLEQTLEAQIAETVQNNENNDQTDEKDTIEVISELQNSTEDSNSGSDNEETSVTLVALESEYKDTVIDSRGSGDVDLVYHTIELPADVISAWVGLTAHGRWHDMNGYQQWWYRAMVLCTLLLQHVLLMGLYLGVVWGIFDSGSDEVKFKFEDHWIDTKYKIYDMCEDDYNYNNISFKNDTYSDDSMLYNCTFDGQIGLKLNTPHNRWLNAKSDSQNYINVDNWATTWVVKVVSLIVLAIAILRDTLKLHPIWQATWHLSNVEDKSYLYRYQLLTNTYAVCWSVLLLTFSETAIEAILNGCAIVFIVEIDEWVYDIAKYHFKPLNDDILKLTLKFNIKKEESKFQESTELTGLWPVCDAEQHALHKAIVVTRRGVFAGVLVSGMFFGLGYLMDQDVEDNII